MPPDSQKENIWEAARSVPLPGSAAERFLCTFSATLACSLHHPLCESWTVKKAERRRTDAFELWCWRRLLRIPWTARRQPWDFFGRNDAKAETPVLWPPHAKS